MAFTAAIICILFLGASSLRYTTARYAACGDGDPEVTEAGLDDNIAGHVSRLMALLGSNHEWANAPEIATAIQLSRPELFQNREETMQKIEQGLNVNATRMSLGEFSQYMLAARAACKNLTNFGGMNLAAEATKRLISEFNYNGAVHTVPRQGWYGVYLALQAYCVTQGESPNAFYIRKVLHSQNQDGSFDHTHSVDHTAQAMLGLICLSRSRTLSQTLQGKVETSLNLASVFLTSKVTSERNKVWISDKYSSPAAVLATKEHSQWTTHGWRCALIMKSLNVPYDDNERESAIAQRLLALKGVSVLELMDKNYTCQHSVNIDTKEQTVLGVTTEVRSSSCSLEDDPAFNAIFAPTLIDVHMSIHSRALTHDVTRQSRSSHFILTDVAKGKTLLRLMTIAQCRGLITFETATTAWGEYITTINGVEAVAANKEYWAILKNGKSLTVGVGQFVPSHSDKVSFRLKTWH